VPLAGKDGAVALLFELGAEARHVGGDARVGSKDLRQGARNACEHGKTSEMSENHNKTIVLGGCASQLHANACIHRMKSFKFSWVCGRQEHVLVLLLVVGDQWWL